MIINLWQPLFTCHCEERSDEAIHQCLDWLGLARDLDCFASLAMTIRWFFEVAILDTEKFFKKPLDKIRGIGIIAFASLLGATVRKSRRPTSKAAWAGGARGKSARGPRGRGLGVCLPLENRIATKN